MIPQKYFYTIGDVCKLTGTKPHVLRYWESQFKLLRPARRYSGHRKYTQREIDLIQRIKHLVVDRKYTLAGAKREINRLNAGASTTAAPVQAKLALNVIADIKNDVDACIELLRPSESERI